ncbi:MAG: hypothetical protein WKG06_12390 [Segetibacter sp.]
MTLLATAKDDNSNQSTLTNSSDLILRNPQYGLDIAGMLSKVPPGQQTYYATVLSQAKTGWTPEMQERYFKWFSNAFKFKGGHSFIGFVNLARKNALANVSKDRFAYYNTISGDSLVEPFRHLRSRCNPAACRTGQKLETGRSCSCSR